MKGGLLYGKTKREQCYLIYALRSLSSLGDMYLALGKNQEAAKAYSQAVTVNARAASVHDKAGSGAGQAW
jgi:predicted negative regulator of RcsB-dependent stress response